MKANKEKDKKNNPQMVRVPEHDRPGRIMSPPPFELQATPLYPAKRKEEEEEIVEGKEGADKV